MKLNSSKTKTMIVSRSHTVHPQLAPLTLDLTVLKESADLVILGLTFDAKMTFEKHLLSVSSAAAKRLGFIRKSWQVFHDRLLLLRSFWSFVLPVLELSPHCSAVWCSAADSHLKLLDRVCQECWFSSWFCLRVQPCPSSICSRDGMLFKIKSNPMHCLCRMCRRVLLLVLWLLIGTRSRLLVVGLFSIAEPLCPSRCLFGTILVTLCLMLRDWRVSRAEPMLSGCHDLLFLFSSPTILSFSFFHGLVV